MPTLSLVGYDILGALVLSLVISEMGIAISALRVVLKNKWENT